MYDEEKVAFVYFLSQLRHPFLFLCWPRNFNCLFSLLIYRFRRLTSDQRSAGGKHPFSLLLLPMQIGVLPAGIDTKGVTLLLGLEVVVFEGQEGGRYFWWVLLFGAVLEPRKLYFLLKFQSKVAG